MVLYILGASSPSRLNNKIKGLKCEKKKFENLEKYPEN